MEKGEMISEFMNSTLNRCVKRAAPRKFEGNALPKLFALPNFVIQNIFETKNNPKIFFS